jgi:hypothetical protein
VVILASYYPFDWEDTNDHYSEFSNGFNFY